MNNRTVLLIVLLVSFLGFFFRVWHLNLLPASLHRDEASIGYNAYALLLTGHDEHGKSWPLSFRAFGDYKLPGLIYLTMPFIYLMGLSEWAVRLPTALSAVFTIPLIYILVRELGWSKKDALVSMILLSFSFWHIAQARNAYEPMVGLCFTLIAWIAWLKAQNNPWWFVVSLIFYFIASLTYNVAWLLLPLLFLGSVAILQKQYFVRKNTTILCLFLVGILGLGLFLIVKDVNVSRKNTTVIDHQVITEESKKLTYAALVSGVPSRIARITNSPHFLAMIHIGKGYFSAFDPVYLFFSGDQNEWHNLRNINFGNSNPISIVWIIPGLYFLVKKRHATKVQLLLLFLLTSPLPSALTIDAPITNRLLDFHTSLAILSAVGLVWIWEVFSHSKKMKSAIVASAALYSGLLLLFLIQYFFVYNYLLTPQWNPELKAMVLAVNELKSDHSAIVITNELQLPYIFFAFYTPFEPTTFAQKAERYESGFDHVATFEEYHFTDLANVEKLLTQIALEYKKQPQKNVLVVTRKPLADPLLDTNVKEIKSWSGEPLWYLWSIPTKIEIPR